MAGHSTVGRYLVRRLEQAGLKHVFGLAGDYVLKFDDLLVASSMEFVTTSTEAGAAFAADGYARVHGLGALCITYCVGGLNAVNAIAGAYAERSPVIVISGAPGVRERVRSPLLHHRVRDFNTQRLIFDQVTVASVVLEDAARAPEQIDETIRACIWSKRPVYIELPRDMVDVPCRAPGPWRVRKAVSDPDSLAEAVAEAASMLKAARRPAVVAGVEIQRWGLRDSLLRLIEHTGYPVATTPLGKSVISERHPQFIGLYEGAIANEGVRRVIERAGCLLLLGDYMTDVNLGIFTARLDASRTVYAAQRRVTVKHHHYDGIYLDHFMDGLRAALPRGRARRTRVRPAPRPFHPRRSRQVTVRRFFSRMNEFLSDDSVVVCDVGESLFGALNLTIHRPTEFLSSAYYTTMGFAVPAAIGAQLADRRLRPIVFVGDGAFQMTGMELSTAARLGLNPIVLVLNNKGYTTERLINEGPVQRHPGLGVPPRPSRSEEGLGLRGEDGGRAGGRAAQGARRHDGLLPHQRAPEPPGQVRVPQQPGQAAQHPGRQAGRKARLRTPKCAS